MASKAIQSKWLDRARRPNGEEEDALHDAVCAWVVGYEVKLDPAIRVDLEPLPALERETLRRVARDLTNAALDRHDIRLRVGNEDRPVLPSLHKEGELLELWSGFAAMLVAYLGGSRYLFSRCDHCGGTFASQRKGSRYCSDACRIAAHRARKATT